MDQWVYSPRLSRLAYGLYVVWRTRLSSTPAEKTNVFLVSSQNNVLKQDKERNKRSFRSEVMVLLVKLSATKLASTCFNLLQLASRFTMFLLITLICAEKKLFQKRITKIYSKIILSAGYSSCVGFWYVMACVKCLFFFISVHNFKFLRSPGMICISRHSGPRIETRFIILALE